MAILSFPSSPANGDLYPIAPLVGQNQYRWEAATQTWRLEGTATGVTPGTYGSIDNIPQVTIDAVGRVTIAVNVPIRDVYVRTNNPAVYNEYVWPNADGGTGTALTTDGAGNLSWAQYRYVQFDDISAGFNGLATTFNLTVSATAKAPSPSTNIMVFVGGVVQIPTTNYTVSGSTITFTGAPLAGTSFYATTVSV